MLIALAAFIVHREASIARREEAKRKMAHDHWVQLKFFTKYGDVEEMQRKDEYEKRWYRRLLRAFKLVAWDQIRVDTHFRHSWDIGMMLVLAWVLTTLPYRLAFGIDPEGVYWIIERLVDLFFVIDIQLNFRTTYVDDVAGVEVFNRRKIAWHYFRTWFVLDLLSSIPFELMAEAYTDNGAGADGGVDGGGAVGQQTRGAKLLKLGKLMKALRILRLSKVGKMAKMIERFEDEYPNFNMGVVKLIKLFVGLLLACHINSTIWVALADTTSRNNWMAALGYDFVEPFDDEHWPEYIVAFYWSVCTMTTVGYGDILPTNYREMVFVSVSMIIGGAYFGYMIALMSALVSKQDANTTLYREKIDAVRSYVRSRHLPKDLQIRVVRYFKHFMKVRSAFPESQIIMEMSSFLRNEVAMHLVDDNMYKIPFFRFLIRKDPFFITKLISLFKPILCAPGDYVVTVGEIGREMYVLNKGELEIVRADGSLLKTLQAGSYFGELSILAPRGQLRSMSVRAKTMSELTSISKDDLFEAFQDFPGLLLEMRCIAIAQYPHNADLPPGLRETVDSIRASLGEAKCRRTSLGGGDAAKFLAGAAEEHAARSRSNSAAADKLKKKAADRKEPEGNDPFAAFADKSGKLGSVTEGPADEEDAGEDAGELDLDGLIDGNVVEEDSDENAKTDAADKEVTMGPGAYGRGSPERLLSRTGSNLIQQRKRAYGERGLSPDDGDAHLADEDMAHIEDAMQNLEKKIAVRERPEDPLALRQSRMELALGFGTEGASGAGGAGGTRGALTALLQDTGDIDVEGVADDKARGTLDGVVAALQKLNTADEQREREMQTLAETLENRLLAITVERKALRGAIANAIALRERMMKKSQKKDE